MTVGDRIRAARESNGMTQGELGKICGVTKQTIFKYESNIITNIPLDKLKLISFGLNVSAAKLMNWETEDGGIDLGLAQLETGMTEEEAVAFISSGAKKPAVLKDGEYQNPDIRMIARAGKKMTPEQAQNLRKYAQYMFPEAFMDDDT